MEELSIKVENVKKQYRLGAIGGATLKGDLQSWYARIRHKEDPNLKIGQKAYAKNEKFMALDGVSFEVKKGEALGIIGHNGAGKSTLLKLISRVTSPTEGTIYMNGRITSMLEVGTGFHPELTGRENVYLNGAILGMTKAEIAEKFDEIVEFSEVGQFIDTPVKRYSSGMFVKLAFSVASHLNSEIMIMDEVLAVGDVNFQNKCINRMKTLSEEGGRTILYVSHNMSTIKKLCQRCIVLSHGKLIFDGKTDDAIRIYMANNALDDRAFFDVSEFKRHRKCSCRHLIECLEMLDKKINVFEYGEPIRLKMRWTSKDKNERVKLKAVINTLQSEGVGVTFAGELAHNEGENETDLVFDTASLVPGKYTVDFILYDEDESGNILFHDRVTCMRFSLEHGDNSANLKHWFSDWGYAVLPCLKQGKE